MTSQESLFAHRSLDMITITYFPDIQLAIQARVYAVCLLPLDDLEKNQPCEISNFKRISGRISIAHIENTGTISSASIRVENILRKIEPYYRKRRVGTRRTREIWSKSPWVELIILPIGQRSREFHTQPIPIATVQNCRCPYQCSINNDMIRTYSVTHVWALSRPCPPNPSWSETVSSIPESVSATAE